MSHLQGASDTDVLLAWQQGNASAFSELYARYEAPLYRYFRRQLNNPPADDVFQELWMRLIASARQFRAESSLKTWLYQIAHNMVIDSWRSERRHDEVKTDTDADSLPGSQHNPEQLDASREQSQALIAAVAALPFEQREAFVLKEEAGFSLEEIAQITGTSRETVKSRLRYAFGKLRSQMEVI